MSNDLNPNTTPVSQGANKPAAPSSAPAVASGSPAPQQTTGKKERFNKKSGGAFGASQRPKL